MRANCKYKKIKEPNYSFSKIMGQNCHTRKKSMEIIKPWGTKLKIQKDQEQKGNFQNVTEQTTIFKF